MPITSTRALQRQDSGETPPPKALIELLRQADVRLNGERA
jgi:hypothetical protein